MGSDIVVMAEFLVALAVILAVLLTLKPKAEDPARLRLVAATVAVLVSVVFAVDYTEGARVIAQHRGLERPMLTELYEVAAPWGLAVVPALLLAARWALRRGASREFWAELLVGCGWLFALAWALGCILAAQLQELPVVQLGD